MESFAKKILDAEARWIWFPDEREMIETEVYTLAVNQRNPGRNTVVRFVLTPKITPQFPRPRRPTDSRDTRNG